MKKKLISLLMVSMMILSLAACKTSETAKDDAVTKAPATATAGEDNSLQYILDNGTLVLGLDDSFPPMGFRDDKDNIVGFDIDLAKAVCEKLGIKLKLQPIVWDAKDQELKTKNVDCIWNGLSLTEENQASMTMTPAYMKNEISLVVTKDSAIKSMADMAGKKLSLQSASAAQETLDAEENKEFKDSLGEVVQLDNYATALMDMDTGNSDAVLMDSIVANYYITEQGKDYSVLSDTLLEDQYSIGFRKGDQALCDAIWNALKELKADGTVAKIATQWFGSDITTIE